MHIYLRGDRLQQLRLASGLALFAFAATHFLNHALGLVSLEAMHQAQELRTAVTRSLPGSLVLGAALLTHIGLAFSKLVQRKTWRLPRWEAVQIALGLAIPFLLLPHIVNTRIAHALFGVNDTYLYELKRLWPDSGVQQSLLLLLVWGHGCIGVHYWLRLSEGYKRFAPALHALAVAVPLLALAGFAAAGRATGDIMSDPEAFAALKARSHWPNDVDSATLAWLRTGSRLAFAAVIAALAGVHLLRRPLRLLRRSRPSITYAGGRTVDLVPGMTLLEASRSAGTPHASVCGGRARCSTCRVRIEEGLESLRPPMGAEAITLRSIEAPPNVRLACQVRPSSSLTVAVVTPPATPGPIRADFVEIRDIVAAHVRANLAGEIVDFASSDPDAIGRWAQGRVTYPIAIRDLAERGFTLVGSRLDFLLDRPAAALVYKRNERSITLFALPHGNADAVALRGLRNGYHVRAWTEKSIGYFAVSDVSAADLDMLEGSLSSAEGEALIPVSQQGKRLDELERIT